MYCVCNTYLKIPVISCTLVLLLSQQVEATRYHCIAIDVALTPSFGFLPHDATVFQDEFHTKCHDCRIDCTSMCLRGTVTTLTASLSLPFAKHQKQPKIQPHAGASCIHYPPMTDTTLRQAVHVRDEIILFLLDSSTYPVSFTPDEHTFIIDTSASITIKKCPTDYLESPWPVNSTTLKGITSGLTVQGIGMASYTFLADDGAGKCPIHTGLTYLYIVSPTCCIKKWDALQMASTPFMTLAF